MHRQTVGVTRSKVQYTNFELVAQWRHLSSGGNSGIFIWASPEGMKDLKPNSLPSVGIEVQVLDHGYTEKYEKSSGKKADCSPHMATSFRWQKSDEAV